MCIAIVGPIWIDLMLTVRPVSATDTLRVLVSHSSTISVMFWPRWDEPDEGLAAGVSATLEDFDGGDVGGEGVAVIVVAPR